MNARFLAVVVTLLAALGCAATQAEAQLGQVTGAWPEPPVKIVASVNTLFALDLYGQLKGQPGNLFFSPYSISTALAMTYAGARGETDRQMAATLHFPLGQQIAHEGFGALHAAIESAQGEGVQMRIANSLWPQKGYVFLPDYTALIGKNYHSPITPVDYENAPEEARKTINAWVEQKTDQKIKDLIAPGALTPDFRLVLVNAIYFKGKWADQFDARRTQPMEFHLDANRKKSVPMMQRRGDYGFRETEDTQILELPYDGDRLSMVVLLPKDVNGLAALEEKLTRDNVAAWLSKLPKEEATVFLPKFKITWGAFDLKGPLQALGMKDAFVEKVADFSGMDGTRNLFIGFVLHKAFVEVNEEGTEAAAATGIGMTTTSVRKSYVFRADHPFVFLIRDRQTDSILFMGRVTDPG